MRKRKRATQTLVLMFFMIVLSLFGLVMVPEEGYAYIPHEPINIVGNGDFTVANGVTGGTGTIVDPYIIEGWEIDASSAMGIKIFGTVAHFIIRDVYVHSGGEGHDGINFVNVANGCVENTTILNNYFGVHLASSSSITVMGSNISNNEYGIRIYYVSYSTVTGNDVSNNAYGIRIHSSSTITIIDNKVSNNYMGVHLSSSTNITLASNALTSDGVFLSGDSLLHYNSHTITADNLVNGKHLYYYKDCAGLDIDGTPMGQLIVVNCTNVRASNLEIIDTDVGIEMVFVDDVIIMGSTISSNDFHGIFLSSSANAMITINNASWNKGDGIHLSSPANVTIAGNKVFWNNGDGIRLYSPNDVAITNNNISNNAFGIFLTSSTNATIADNDISCNDHSGIHFYYSTNDVIMNNNISSHSVYGIYLQSSINATITGNSLSKNEDGMLLYHSTSATIAHNKVFSNIGSGIGLSRSIDAVIKGNNVFSHSAKGFFFYSPTNAVITENNVSNNAYGLFIWLSTNTIVMDNNVSNNPWGVFFTSSTNDVVIANYISKNGHSVHFTSSSKNATIITNEVSNNTYGIRLMSSKKASITDNIILNNGDGIGLSSPADATIRGNKVSKNGYGIRLWSSASATVVSNDVSSNTYDGIRLEYSTDDTVVGNSVSNNEYGVYFHVSTNGIVTNNSISNNDYGSFLWSSTGILLHHNNFIDNVMQAFDNRGNENSWDDGYPSGGNYWSDYTGIDECSGPNQDICPDPDRIGDTPYIIDADSRDNYPLTEPSNIPPMASFTLSPSTGNVTTVFAVDASSSWDLEDSITDLEVRWDWEDDGTWDTSWSTVKTAQHQYADPGNYTIRLEVKDTQGAADQTTGEVSVENTPPLADFTIIPLQGNVSTIFEVDASSSADLEDSVTNLEVRWDWEDDGVWDTTWSTVKIAQHQYARPGKYTIHLEVRDTYGATDRTRKQVSVENTPPTASFDVLPTSGSITTVFHVDASSSWDLEDSITDLEVRWDWEDDGTWDTSWSAEKTASHQYASLGTHTICLEVRDTDALTNNATKHISVLPAPVTSLVIGQPNHTTVMTSVTSSTPLDFSILDQSGSGILRTMFRIDNTTWINYTATGTFTLAGERAHYLEWFSEGLGGNLENVTATVLIVDDTPPDLSVSIGSPSYVSTENWIASSTPIDIEAADGGVMPVGLDSIEYRVWFGSWSSWSVYSSPLTLSAEGMHFLECRASDLLGNMAVSNTSLTVDNTPPTTSIFVGNPKHQAVELYVTSTTEISLSSVDGGGVPVGLESMEYRIDGAAWFPYLLHFNLEGEEGQRIIEYRSRDFIGNLEVVKTLEVFLDNAPPTTVISIGEPKYLGGGNFVTSSTPLTLQAADDDVGSNSISFRIWDGSWTPWATYQTSVHLTGQDNPRHIEYRSTDLLGNQEQIHNLTLIVDNTPPVTIITSSAGPYDVNTVFTLEAVDEGSGVLRTEFRIDGGAWSPYTSAFTLPEGGHTILYQSLDCLDNLEPERTLQVDIGMEPPPLTAGQNQKPLVAAIFALVLALIGLWSSRRRPWKGDPSKAGVFKAFVLTSMPFVLAEVVTGIVSLFTGHLSIPPAAGVGTAVDIAILVTGILVIVLRLLKARSFESKDK
ncbi:MAG: right-handed parallel beta-helix repeat-containing protein [Thermoplasmata archaeon]|nr:right-handed parallel beta-helix repeat-containing protein [Thermoplasmata archaeon]